MSTAAPPRSTQNGYSNNRAAGGYSSSGYQNNRNQNSGNQNYGGNPFPKPETRQLTEEDGVVDNETVMRLMVEFNDVSILSRQQRHLWYLLQCEQAGLDPQTQPFIYVILSGKMTLYPTKKAAEMLCQKHCISTHIIDEKEIRNTYFFKCQAKTPDGRTTDASGGVGIGNLDGDKLANAIMKAETKSRRRAVLAHCGLGMLDETEVDTVPGHIKMATPEQLNAYNTIRREAVGLGLKTKQGNELKECDEFTPQDEVLERTEVLRRRVANAKRAPKPAGDSAPNDPLPTSTEKPASATTPLPADTPAIPDAPKLSAFRARFTGHQSLSDFFNAVLLQNLILENDADFEAFLASFCNIIEDQTYLDIENWTTNDLVEATGLIDNLSLRFGDETIDEVTGEPNTPELATAA